MYMTIQFIQWLELSKMTSPVVCSFIPNVVLDAVSACEASAKDLSENKIDAIFGGKRLVINL
jgi:hypothetical protein